jgi:hypothetical protein
MKASDLSTAGGLVQNSGNGSRQLSAEEYIVLPKTEGSEK